MADKKIKMEYTVDIFVEGYADDNIPFFQEVADDEMKSLWKDVTSARVCEDGVVRSASVKIAKCKIVSRKVL